MQRITCLIIIAGLLASGCTACSSEKEETPAIKPTPTPDPDPEPDDPDKPQAEAIEAGKTIPAWQKGQMDIHFINTTMGESIFVIFPDGTQMLIDAASSLVATNSSNNTTNTGIRSRWDPTKTGTRGSEIISDYLRKCMAWTGNSTIDYALLTHFHSDHFGGYSYSLPVSEKSPTYRLNGFSEIFDNFKIGKLIDRGYPDYDYPFDMATMADNAAACTNYINAVKYHVAQGDFTAEIFKPGVSTQIVENYEADKYPGVKVQNIAVNGEIWTGNGSATKKTFPTKEQVSFSDSKNITSADNCPPENINSCVMKISYGAFDFFAGADLQYNGRSSHAWKDAELPCAQAAGQVELMKADHHGTTNTNQTDALKALDPQTIVVCSWVDSHPRTAVLNNMETVLPSADIYITNFWRGERPEGVDDKVTDAEAARVKGYDGHVVVRVAEGGGSYVVATITDSDGKMTVKTVSDKYKCR